MILADNTPSIEVETGILDSFNDDRPCPDCRTLPTFKGIDEEEEVEVYVCECGNTQREKPIVTN